MTHEMDPAERDAFLDALPARPAILAVTRKDGRPIGVPVWYARDGEDLIFNTNVATLKGKSIMRDGNISLTVQDPMAPFSYVIAEGEATWEDGADDLLHWATVIGGRYMGEDVAEQYGTRNAVPGELVVRLRPTRWQSAKDVAS